MVALDLTATAVSAHAVDLDDEAGVRPVGIDEPAADVDIHLRDGDTVAFAELQQQDLGVAAGPRERRQMDCNGVSQRRRASDASASERLERFEIQ